MKKFVFMLFAAFIGFGGVVHEVEAKRLGGGKSFGSQRDSSVMKRDATPAPTQNSATAQRPGQTAGAAAQPAKRSWMGPLAGLAAGLGLAALASHLGFGEEMASFMMIALLVVAALFLWRMFARRKAGVAPPAMQYAGAAAGTSGAAGSAYAPPQVQPFESAAAAGGSSAAMAAASIPADFDVAGFLRQAKLNFVRLQAANDSGDVEDIRSFTSPEVFAEIRMQLQERGTSAQHTDVVQVDAVLLDVSTEGDQYIASVRFYGLVREEADASPESFDEVWHLSKPVSGERGWLISGIQQME